MLWSSLCAHVLWMKSLQLRRKRGRFQNLDGVTRVYRAAVWRLIRHYHRIFHRRFYCIRLVEFDADDFADAVFFHRHAVEDVGHANGAFVVGNDDELRMIDEPLQ